MVKVIFGNHCAVRVFRTERDRIRKFYCDILGCKIMREFDDKDDIRMGDDFYIGFLYGAGRRDGYASFAVRSIPIFLAVIFISITISAQLAYPYNGSFESVNGNNMPRIWYAAAIDTARGYAVTSDSTVSFEGKRSLLVRPLDKYYKKGSNALIYQQIDLGVLPTFRRLKVVEYIRTAANLDSTLLFLGFNKICTPGERSRHEEHSFEKVYKGNEMWYKVTTAADVDSNCVTVNCWNVVTCSEPLYIDNLQIFIDDKKVDDIPLPPDEIPAGADLAWLKSHFREIDLALPESLPKEFTQDIGSSRIVALGESTHGTSGFYALRAAISKQLVETNGFTVLAFENELGPSLDINKAILTDMPVRQIVDTFFSAIYRSKEMDDLLEWVRSYNRSSKNKVLLAGFDMQSYYSDIVRLKHLCQQDSAVTRGLLQMDTLQQKARSLADFDSLHRISIQCAALFHQLPVNNFPKPGRDSLAKVQLLKEKLFGQLINAYQKKILEKSTGVTNTTLPQDGNFRDSLMADNVLWLNRVYFPGKKIIIWAHDEHVTRRQNMARSHYYYKSTRTMGEYLEKAYPGKFKTFAYLTASGEVTGFDQYANPGIYDLEEPAVDSYEYWMNSCNKAAGYVSLDPSGIPAEHLRLFRYLRWRSLGFYGWKVPFREYNLVNNFDGLFFVRHSIPTKVHHIYLQ